MVIEYHNKVSFCVQLKSYTETRVYILTNWTHTWSCGRGVLVQELNARIQIGCPSISAPACFHLHHLPFSPRMTSTLSAHLAGRNETHGDMPHSHKASQALPKEAIGVLFRLPQRIVAGGNGTVQYPASSTMWRSPCSAPGNIVALWRYAQYI